MKAGDSRASENGQAGQRNKHTRDGLAITDDNRREAERGGNPPGPALPEAQFARPQTCQILRAIGPDKRHRTGDHWNGAQIREAGTPIPKLLRYHLFYITGRAGSRYVSRGRFNWNVRCARTVGHSPAMML